MTIGCRTGYKIAWWTIKDKLLINNYNLYDFLNPISKNRTPNIFKPHRVVSAES